MGKYTHLRGQLPTFELESAFQQKVTDAKTAYQALSVADLAREFGMQRKEKDAHEEAIKVINVELEALSQLIVEDLEAGDLQKVQIASGATVYTQVEPYSSVENKEALLAYIKKAKMQALLTLPWQTLNALNKERLIGGKQVLPGSRCFLKTSARLRGANQTNGDE